LFQSLDPGLDFGTRGTSSDAKVKTGAPNGVTLASCGTIAILIIGELRFKSRKMFNNFLLKIQPYTIYISTYSRYSLLANKITNNVLFLDKSDTYNPSYQRNMYQWLHLQNLLRNYKGDLIKYDTLYKIRTDIVFDSNLFNQEINDNIIYSFTDIVFFGKSNYFITIFENFFDDILLKYCGPYDKYFTINYTNLLNSDNQAYKWNWLTYPAFIYNHNYIILRENIINNINNLDKIDTNTLFVSRMPFTPKGIFSSEKIFGLRCLEYGIIKYINLPLKLRTLRKSFNYNI
jgi:hypothetical protein